MNDIQATKVTRLRQLHGEIVGAVRLALDKAIEAGGILQKVKESLPHGEFTAWVEANAGFNIRTAQRYMKIHGNRDRLKNESVSLLTDAYKMLTAPKEERLSDEEREELAYREGVFEKGLQEALEAGLPIDEALKAADWDMKFAILNKKNKVSETQWQIVKDSKSLFEVVDFYHKAEEATQEATALTFDAEMNLGRVLNELERDYPEEYQKMIGKKGRNPNPERSSTATGKSEPGYYIPPPGCALMISAPAQKILFALVCLSGKTA
jgi:hypothetical protein